MINPTIVLMRLLNTKAVESRTNLFRVLNPNLSSKGKKILLLKKLGKITKVVLPKQMTMVELNYITRPNNLMKRQLQIATKSKI